MLTVAELDEHLAKRQESAVTAKLSDFSVNDDASLLTVSNGDQHRFTLDDSATKALTKFLKIPTTFYEHLTPDFRATTLRYMFDRHRDVDAVLEGINGEVIAVHQPSVTMLPLSRVAQVVGKVLKPEDSIRRLIADETHLHIDATTDQHRIEFHEPGTEAKVGDITEAGFRVLSYPFQAKAPSVGVYAERLICSNGMTTPEQLGKITLKGRTVDEVIEEMEGAANLVLAQLDDYLDKLAQTRTMPVPGTPQAFAAQLAREANLSRQVLDVILEQVNQLVPPVTIWDVTQIVTATANQVGNYRTAMRLQTLGGSLAFDAEQMVHRCNVCERLL